MQTPPSDNWDTPQKILVILAHPDDPEFFCGASLARWAKAGHEITYCLLTCGDKGNANTTLSGDDLCQRRHEEQRNAAKIIGAKEVHFLDRPDGYLGIDISTRRAVTRAIRQFAPDILVTCDPTNLFPSDYYPLNHPDHRAAGQVVLDAVFPAAGSELFFPELLSEGHQPHQPREVWLSLTREPNVILDVTKTWDTKINAILEHKSQVRDPQRTKERMQMANSANAEKRYEEHFRVLRWG